MVKKRKEEVVKIENPKHRDKAKEWQELYEALSKKVKEK